jgi:hypothetical protein
MTYTTPGVLITTFLVITNFNLPVQSSSIIKGISHLHSALIDSNNPRGIRNAIAVIELDPSVQQ